MLIEHLCNCLSHLVLHHHCKGIPHEMVGHYKDIFHHRGLIQLHHGLYGGVIEIYQLQWGIHSNQTEGSPWHLSLKCLAVRASPHYGSAILSHHGPPEPLLSESQGPLLALMAGIKVMFTYVVRRCGRLAPRQPLSVCALLPAYEGSRHLWPLGNLGHRLR